MISSLTMLMGGVVFVAYIFGVFAVIGLAHKFLR